MKMKKDSLTRMYAISESVWKILEECIVNNLGNIQSEFNQEDLKGFKRKKKSSPWNKEMDPSPDSSVKNDNPSDTFDTSGENSGETPSKNNSTDSTSTLKNNENETLENLKSSSSLSSSSSPYTSTPKGKSNIPPIRCPIRSCEKPVYVRKKMARLYLPKHLLNTHGVTMETDMDDNDTTFFKELEKIKRNYYHKKSPSKSSSYHTPQSSPSPGKTSSPSPPKTRTGKRRRFASSQSSQLVTPKWMHNQYQ